MTRTRLLVLLALSPTRLFIELSMRDGGVQAARKVIYWNARWLCVESTIAAILLTSTIIAEREVVHNWLSWILGIVAIYRVNEIFYAFYDDSSKRLSRSKPRTPLGAAQRIKLAMRSYLSLTIDFAVIAFVLPQTYYYHPLKTFVDALYFSGITIATLGYGDITPINPISKFFSVYEVFSGVLLVVVALGVYFNRLGAKNGV